MSTVTDKPELTRLQRILAKRRGVLGYADNVAAIEKRIAELEAASVKPSS